MSVDFQMPSPLQTTAGVQVYSFVGTSQAVSVGAALAYTGLGLQNPVGSKVKITVLKVGVAHAGGVAGTSIPVGWGKLIGSTATLGTLSVVNGTAGVVIAPGITGTASCVGLLFGTASVLNGTASPGPNALNYVTMVGGFSGTGVWATPPNELLGEATLMPGEAGCIMAQAAVTGLPYISWSESPIQ